MALEALRLIYITMRDEALPDGTAIRTKEWKESDAKEWCQISQQQAANSPVLSAMDVDGNEHPARMGLTFLWPHSLGFPRLCIVVQRRWQPGWAHG